MPRGSKATRKLPPPPKTYFVGIRNVAAQYPVAFRTVYQARDAGRFTIVNLATGPRGNAHGEKLIRSEVEEWLIETGRITSNELLDVV